VTSGLILEVRLGEDHKNACYLADRLEEVENHLGSIDILINCAGQLNVKGGWFFAALNL